MKTELLVENAIIVVVIVAIFVFISLVLVIFVQHRDIVCF